MSADEVWPEARGIGGFGSIVRRLPDGTTRLATKNDRRERVDQITADLCLRVGTIKERRGLCRELFRWGRTDEANEWYQKLLDEEQLGGGR